MDFPRYEVSMTLTHNEHRIYYEDPAQWIEDNKWAQWKDQESKDRAIKTNSIWTIQWFPVTPIGSYAFAAPTCDEVLAMAKASQS